MDDTKNCCHSQYLTDQHEGNSTIYLSLLKKKKEKNFFYLRYYCLSGLWIGSS